MSIDHAVVSPVVVQRWKRFGHDRAYVKIGDQDLGYRDLTTGEVHCDRPDAVDTVTRATADLFGRAHPAAGSVGQAYTPRHGMPEDVAPAVPHTAPEGRSPAMLPDRDLAANLPGESARRQAVDLRDAAPVRTFLHRVVGAKTDERAWRIGADGEAEIARRLAKLGPQWRVLHAVPVGERGSDIDHVVIGPGGVFTVNAKNHPQATVWVGGDCVRVNGHNQFYVRNSRHEAARAAALLRDAAGAPVQVHGVVAILGAQGGFTVREQPRGGAVSVVTGKRLVARLLDAPRVLDDATVERIHILARHLATWHPATVRWEDFATSTPS